MLGPSANPAMIVGVITAFFLLTGYLSYLMGKKDSGSGHKGASFWLENGDQRIEVIAKPPVQE